MKLTLDPKDWSEPRFEAMRRSMSWTQAEALGVLVLFWHGTREAGIVAAPRQELQTYMSVPPATAASLFDVLGVVGYLSKRGDKWEVVGNEQAVRMLKNRREWGKLGNKKAAAATAKQPVAPDPDKAKAKALTLAGKEANKRCREAYLAAYRDRYGCEPLMDARFHAMVANFVKRVGQDRAPDIVTMFVSLNDPLYVKGAHAMNLALRDADALHTQWEVGPMAPQDPRLAAQEAHVTGQLRRI